MPSTNPRRCCLNCRHFNMARACFNPSGVMYGKTVIMPGTRRNCPVFKLGHDYLGKP